MGCHLPYQITQRYLPPDTGECAPPNSSHAGWYSIYLLQRDGRLSWPSWLDSAPVGSPTSDLSITSLMPNHCTTKTAVNLLTSIIIVHWHVDGSDCCLMGIVLGVTVKKYPQQQYWPMSVPNNPIPVSFSFSGVSMVWRHAIYLMTYVASPTPIAISCVWHRPVHCLSGQRGLSPWATVPSQLPVVDSGTICRTRSPLLPCCLFSPAV